MRAWCDRGISRVVRGSGLTGGATSSLRTGAGDEINIAVDEHWHNLLRAMGRENLRDDPVPATWPIRSCETVT
jgi:hypothetical protein